MYTDVKSQSVTDIPSNAMNVWLICCRFIDISDVRRLVSHYVYVQTSCYAKIDTTEPLFKQSVAYPSHYASSAKGWLNSNGVHIDDSIRRSMLLDA